ncbi:head-tail connector protein [Pandoraea soli]
MAELIEYLSADALASEPVSLDEVKMQARIDPDLTDDDLFIQTVVIPGARQQAETRTGSVLRPARYRQVLPGFPRDSAAITLASGNVQVVESVTYAEPHGLGTRLTLDLTTTEVVTIDRETVISRLAGRWPHCGRAPRAVEIIYTAGMEPATIAAHYPSIKAWILMACAWAYAQREMFLLQSRGSGYQELPADYMQALLDPLKLPPRW